ncbi:MAG TPA: flagellar basal body-associated FliL family protein [Brevundimonas sp.]|uniref:flagellar basal body-associated FliL family protein n=1 Tax=Brevundimonas sp. TaxID=1871086 RepID=UPI00261B2D7C|nr:flagellar basal body-associated FliL family protein [Brevundimonas sp.]HRO32064.1 flagellar basal body-associated FliL family protein [Brevundimonas sp.]
MLKLGKKKDKPADDAAVPAVADGEAGAEDAAPAKKKLPLLFIIIPAALVVLGGGGAAAFMLMQPKPAAAHGEEKADEGHGEKKGGGHGKAEKKGGGHGKEGGEADPAAGKIAEGPDGVTFYTLPDMVVNVQSADGRPTFLKLKLTLEMKDAALAEHLQAEAPRMQDMFQSFLRELRPEEMQGSAATYQLKAELLRRINLIAAPGKVDAVLIEEMLVQ